MLEFRSLASSSAGCCYVVSGGGTTAPLMIDAGIPVAQIRAALGYSLGQIGACVISHSHLDHCKAANALTNAGIDIWASRETLDAIGSDRPYRTHVLTDGELVEDVSDWSVYPFAVQHDVAGALGFVIGSTDGDRLLYLTDSCWSPKAFRGLTAIAAECNHSESILRANVDAGVIDRERFARTAATHMSLERLLVFLGACDLSTVRQIWLLHLSSTNSDAVAFKAAVEQATGIPTTVCDERGGQS